MTLGCGGPTFATAASGGGGAGGAAGGTGGGAGSDAGLSCKPCGAGEYCQVSTGKCVGCSDLSQLSFGSPEPLTAVNANPAGGLRFPRVASTNGKLMVYVASNNTMKPPGHRIWGTASIDTSPGAAVSDVNVSASAPLSVQFDYVSGATTDFLFDAVETPKTSTGLRNLYGTTSTSGQLPTPAPLTAPFNAVGADDYSIAVAADASRAWWMSDRGSSGRQLITFGWDPNSAPQPVALSVQSDAQDVCPRAGTDATPWATPDGKVLLFSATRLGTGCHPADSGKRDIYWINLDVKTGRPAFGAVGQPLLSGSQTGVDLTDPSLSPDSCTLYYAADDGSGFKLYRASRR